MDNLVQKAFGPFMRRCQKWNIPPFNIHVKNVTFIGFLNYTTTNKMYVRQLIIIFYAHVAKSLTLTEDKAPLEPQDRLLKSKVKTETIRFQSETEHVESFNKT